MVVIVVMPMAVAMPMLTVIVGMGRVGISLTMLGPVSTVGRRMVMLPMRVGVIVVGMIMWMIVLIVQGAGIRLASGYPRRAPRWRPPRCSRHVEASSY